MNLQRNPRSRWLALIAVLALLVPVVAAAGKEPSAADEMEAGYRAARRGYWQEALMRFESANAKKPQQPEILNNLAVALEAVGRYEEARETYERGLQIAPSDKNLKRNHLRFKEFYASFVDRENGDEGADEQRPEEGQPDEDNDNGTNDKE